MKIIFVRHGQTDTNVRGKMGEAITEDDAPLNSEGHKQAESVAFQLKDKEVDAIFASPLKRALGTAEEINRFHNAPIIKLDGLKERSCGVLIGARFDELFDFDKNIKADDIESLEDFFQMIYDTIEQIKASGYHNVVVVSHGGVSHAFRAYFNNLEWKGNLRVDKLKHCEFRIYNIDDKDSKASAKQ